jgi:antitoxin component YwqK of YwqJK toxin-antitoxin module
MNGLSKMWDSNGNLLYEYTNVNDEREGEGIIYEY